MRGRRTPPKPPPPRALEVGVRASIVSGFRFHGGGEDVVNAGALRRRAPPLARGPLSRSSRLSRASRSSPRPASRLSRVRRRLRDDEREDEEILEYLKSENEYSRAVTAHLKGSQDALYREFLSRCVRARVCRVAAREPLVRLGTVPTLEPSPRQMFTRPAAPRRSAPCVSTARSIQETDHSTPRPRGNHWYYTRTFKGSSYPTYCRAPRIGDSLEVDWDGTRGSPVLPGEEAYLDVNALADGRSYCSVGSVEVSPSRRLVAYAVDYSGDEKYEMHVKDLETGVDVAMKEAGTDGKLLEVDGLVWGKDDRTLYYTTMDEQHRPFRLFQRKNWKSDEPTDTLLKEELDDLFWW